MSGMDRRDFLKYLLGLGSLFLGGASVACSSPLDSSEYKRGDLVCIDTDYLNFNPEMDPRVTIGDTQVRDFIRVNKESPYEVLGATEGYNGNLWLRVSSTLSGERGYVRETNVSLMQCFE